MTGTNGPDANRWADIVPPQHPPWGRHVPLTWVTEPDPDYAWLVTELRAFLDDLAAARPEPAESGELAAALQSWRERLRRTAGGEDGQVFGRRPDLPSRGHTMLPKYVVHDVDEQSIRATVSFGRYYLGAGEAVHGGVIPLVFDELLGTLTNFRERQSSRTASLSVNFRAITPLDTDLEVTGRIERTEGRKTYVSGELRHGELLCADAQALFIAVRPGQMRAADAGRGRQLG